MTNQDTKPKPTKGSNGSGKLSLLTDAQLHSLAKRHLSGHTSVDLVGFANLDVFQIRTLLRSPKMRRIIKEEQEYLDGHVTRIRNRMSYGIEDSVDRMKSRGQGCDGPQIAFQADKFLIDTLMPKQEKHLVESHSTHSFDAQVVVQINDALDTLKTITGNNHTNQDDTKYTLLGTEGIADIEPQEPVTGKAEEPVTPGPLGSDNPQPTSKFTGPPTQDSDTSPQPSDSNFEVEVSGGQSEPPPTD